MSLLWPRLPDSAAESRLQQVRAARPEEVPGLPAFDHPAQVYAATGGARTSDGDLQHLRMVVLETAGRFGFPGRPSDGVAFDRALAPQLVDAMRISAAEAARPGIWSFLSLILCPDVTHWRFGVGNGERWVASDLTRHMFSRLWWQAFLLTEPSADGGRDTTLLDSLNESELNQLLERTRIGGVRPLVRAVARHVLSVADPDVPRRALIREVTSRVRREMAIIDFLALTPEQLDADIGAVVAAAVVAIRTYGAGDG